MGYIAIICAINTMETHTCTLVLRYLHFLLIVIFTIGLQTWLSVTITIYSMFYVLYNNVFMISLSAMDCLTAATKSYCSIIYRTGGGGVLVMLTACCSVKCCISYLATFPWMISICPSLQAWPFTTSYCNLYLWRAGEEALINYNATSHLLHCIPSVRDVTHWTDHHIPRF